MCYMVTTSDRQVIISARQLADLLELAQVARDRLPEYDALTRELTGSIAAVRDSAVLEPR